MTISSWNPDLLESPEAAGVPLYRRLALRLEDDIRAGRLSAGEKLPTHRDLADRLGVNVGTVSRAYAECERGGWIRGEVGRGTFVGGAANDEERFGRGPVAPGRELVDLSLNYPVRAPVPDLAASLRALAAEVERGEAAEFLAYAETEGSPDERAAGAEALALHGVDVAPRDVLVASGAQHGLFAALAATCRPGEAIAAESLTYPGLRAAAEMLGLRVLPLAMDEEGVLPEALEDACANGSPRVFYTSPTLQNPTTSTLSETRRAAIAEIASRHGVWIVEDDVHRLLEPDAAPPLASRLPERTVYLASLSKCLAPALRIAWVAAPPALASALSDALWCTVWTHSPLTAALASAWVRDGTLERVAAGRRREARARQSLAAEVLGALPDGFRLRAAPTAYHGWLELPVGTSASAFANAAREQGVAVSPAGAFHLGPGPAPAAVRLSLSAAPDRASLHRGLSGLLEAARQGSEARVRV